MEVLAWVLLLCWPGQLCPPSSWSTVLPLLPGSALLFPLSQPLPLPFTEGGFCSPVRMGSNAVNPLDTLWGDPSPALQGWRSLDPAVGHQHSVGELWQCLQVCAEASWLLPGFPHLHLACRATEQTRPLMEEVEAD